MIMETEMDTDTDTDSDDDEDTGNIYEEVLNHESYGNRQHHGRLSTTSSLYSSNGWTDNREGHGIRSFQYQVKQNEKATKPEFNIYALFFRTLALHQIKTNLWQKRNLAEQQSPILPQTFV